MAVAETWLRQEEHCIINLCSWRRCLWVLQHDKFPSSASPRWARRAPPLAGGGAWHQWAHQSCPPPPHSRCHQVLLSTQTYHLQHIYRAEDFLTTFKQSSKQANYAGTPTPGSTTTFYSNTLVDIPRLYFLTDLRSTTTPVLTTEHSVELTPSNAVQSDGGALGEGGGAKPGWHCSVGGHLVGGDGRPRQRLQRGQEETSWDLGRAHFLRHLLPSRWLDATQNLTDMINNFGYFLRDATQSTCWSDSNFGCCGSRFHKFNPRAMGRPQSFLSLITAHYFLFYDILCLNIKKQTLLIENLRNCFPHFSPHFP